jgi:uncharacterized protein (DUF1330 family)
MPFEITVGLLVVDNEKYAQYRAKMTPLLEAMGGRFRYDFEVARTLKGEAGHEINRAFVIQFPDRAGKERFFKDPEYMDIRARFFEKAVRHTTIIAEYST